MTEMEGASDAVARNLQEIRRRRGITAAVLAQACADAGFPDLTASVIANIETGRRDQEGRRRRAVTVDEVYALAQVLGVGLTRLLPPPPGRTEEDWQSGDRFHEFQRGIEQFISRLGLDAEIEQKYLARVMQPGVDFTQVLRELQSFVEEEMDAGRVDSDQIRRVSDELVKNLQVLAAEADDG